MDSRRMCPNCRAFITNRDKVCPYCNERVAPRAVDVRSPGAIMGGFIPHARFVTMMILTINCGLYLATVVFSAQNGGGLMSVDGRTLFEFGAKYRLAILGYGQWWRLVTAGFLHGGLLHIGMNSWVLFDLGAQVEDVFGASRLIVIYFLGTVFGFLLSTFWTDAISVGASAGIMGLLGAMIALGMRNRHTAEGAALRGMYVRWAVYILILGVLPGLHIDNAAHIGGLAAGFAVAYVAGTPRIAQAWSERMWRVAAGVCVAITAGCFLMMYLSFTANAQ
ncbi:MAG: rhomboid family intramembrane serine protease [Bryobacteraceae bacterium]